MQSLISVESAEFFNPDPNPSFWSRKWRVSVSCRVVTDRQMGKKFSSWHPTTRRISALSHGILAIQIFQRRTHSTLGLCRCLNVICLARISPFFWISLSGLNFDPSFPCDWPLVNVMNRHHQLKQWYFSVSTNMHTLSPHFTNDFSIKNGKYAFKTVHSLDEYRPLILNFTFHVRWNTFKWHHLHYFTFLICNSQFSDIVVSQNPSSNFHSPIRASCNSWNLTSLR